MGGRPKRTAAIPAISAGPIQRRSSMAIHEPDTFFIERSKDKKWYESCHRSAYYDILELRVYQICLDITLGIIVWSVLGISLGNILGTGAEQVFGKIEKIEHFIGLVFIIIFLVCVTKAYFNNKEKVWNSEV